MRNYATNSSEIKTEQAMYTLSCYDNGSTHSNSANTDSNSLFVFPAQCNFSGSKYPLSWIDKVKNGALNSFIKEKSTNWYVVLDAASYISTNNLDLNKYKPDFVPISFYKMFGYPTGIGALLVKKTSENLLVKKYFGGGTIFMALSSKNVMVPRSSMQERFEDGTLPFLSILAIKHGFDTINRLNLNFDLISQHTFSLAQYVYRNLLLMHHSNGNPVVVLYHDTVFSNRDHQGGIVNFNLLRPNGDFIGYSEVSHMSNLHGIQIRTGCSCNPGACQRFLKLSTDDVKKHFDAGHVCGDQHDLVDNYPTGSVRISFGYMTTQEDADKLLNMIENCFISQPVIRKLPRTWHNMQTAYEKLYLGKSETENETETKILSKSNLSACISNHNTDCYKEAPVGKLQQILVYPIKSCGAFSAENNWIITSKGLKYDREWMITGPTGVCLTQKHNKNLCLIKPTIDLKEKILKLKFKGQPDFELNLMEPSNQEKKAYLCQSKVCGDRIQGWDCGDEVSDWLSETLRTPGLRLLHQCHFDEEISGRILKNETSSQLSLANKAQYLLINSKSVEWLMQKIPENELIEDKYSVIQRFRPNLVVNFSQPFQENKYGGFLFNDIPFQSAGKCTRCQMICINQSSGEISKEPLLTLSREFKGKIAFGVYLNQDIANEERMISIGCSIIGKTTEMS
ncbi:molybdenum cofactor sulfurase 3 isoform X2 [Anoplophora glabripennis]|nr:molybdenum cofactor sulfurase 3 isoform X2 [Anoplophora glabripennis]